MVDELIESDLSIHSVYATGQWIRSQGMSRLSSHGSDRKITKFTNENISMSVSGSRSSSGEFLFHEITEAELSMISNLSAPNKVLAIVHTPSHSLVNTELENSLTLVLENIQDPGNLGTLIRTCDWFGIENIILSGNSADITNPKVVQSSMGSILRIKSHYMDLPSFLQQPEIKALPLFGAFIDGPDIYSQALPEHGMIILGNESRGISVEVAKLIRQRISIPPFPGRNKSPESLNMAVAGSIIISEFRRRTSQ